MEFALILPVLMALVLGLFTGGISYNRKIAMTSAVREGARFGATLQDSSTWASTVASRVQQLAAGDLTSAQICVSLVKAPSTVVRSSPASCPFPGEPANPAGTVAGTCLVKVWAQRSSELQAFFFTWNLSLEAEAVGRYERTC